MDGKSPSAEHFRLRHCDCKRRVAAFDAAVYSYGAYGPRLTDSSEPQVCLEGAVGFLGLGIRPYLPAHSGSLLPGAGQAGTRLVRDSGLLTRLPGADLCRLLGVEQAKDTARNQNCPLVERSWRGCSRTDSSGPGSLWRRAVPFPHLAPDPPRRAGALLWRLAAAQRTTLCF